MSIFPKKTFYLILGLNILLLIGGGILVWQIEEEKIELATSLNQSSLSKTAGEELLAVWSKLEPQLITLDNYFLSASTTVEFLERLESNAALTKTAFKINQVEANGDLRINFSVQGNFLGVNQFLINLEKFPYALRIERFDLRLAAKDLWRGDFVISVVTQK